MDGELNDFQNMNLLSWSVEGRHTALSQDEIVIRSRGKRKIPSSFSPGKKEEAGMVPMSPATPVKIRDLSPGNIETKFRPGFVRSLDIKAKKNLFFDGDGLGPLTKVPVDPDTVESESDSSIDHSEETPAKKKKTTEQSFNLNNNDVKSEDSLKLIKVLSHQKSK